MDIFSNSSVNLDLLKERAYNLRWAEVPDGVIPLTAADQDFPVAPEIQRALIAYIQGGYFPYVPGRGLPAFRTAMSRALSSRKGEQIPPEYILPVDSAASGMMSIARAFLRPGDEVLVFDPVDFLFRTTMEAAGAVVRLFPSRIRDGYVSLEGLEDYLTPKTRMLGLCNPHNPLGLLYRREELSRLLDLSERYGFYIMNDEIWSDIIYPDGEFISLHSFGAERNRRTVSVYGFSKAFGLAGLRVGAVYASEESIYEAVAKASMSDATVGGVSSLSQIAATAALEQAYGRVDAFVAHLTANRDYALARLNAMPGIRCHKATATFVLFPDITGTGMEPVPFTELLKERYRLSIVPGGERFFGPGSEGHVRICLATSREILEEGLNRLEACVTDLARR